MCRVELNNMDQDVENLFWNMNILNNFNQVPCSFSLLESLHFDSHLFVFLRNMEVGVGKAEAYICI